MVTLRSKTILLVLGVSLIAYIFTAAGYVDTIDATPSIETAKAFFYKGKFSYPRSRWFKTVDSPVSISGTEYRTKMGLAYPILYLIPVGIADTIEKNPALRETILGFFVSLVNPILTSLLLILVLLVFNSLGFSEKESIFLSFTLAFATSLWPYAKTCQREVLQAVALVGVLFETLRRKPILAGLFFSLGVLTKLAWLIPAFPILFWSANEFKRERRKALYLGVASCIGPAFYFLYNWILWGSPFHTGYSSGTSSMTGIFWTTPFINGLHAQLTSWKTGLLAYNPILILVFLGFVLKLKEKKGNRLDIALLFSILLQASFYARWLDPLGGQTLGPRYLVVVLPLFFFLLDKEALPFLKKPLLLALCSLLLVYSFLLQVVFNSVKVQEVHELRTHSSIPLNEAPWITQTKLFVFKTIGRKEIYNLKEFGGDEQWVDLTPYRSFNGFNFWWAHFLRQQSADSKKIARSP